MQKTIGNLYRAHNSIRRSEIDEKLIALVELRGTGYAYCCSYHAKELSDFGIEQDIINRLHTNAFNELQKLVFSMGRSSHLQQR